MASAPINSPQAQGVEASVGLIAGKTASFGYKSTSKGLRVPITPNINVQALAIDALAVIAQDSVRSGNFVVEPKLVASYVADSALYDIWGATILMPLLKNIDAPLRYDFGKFLWNSALLPVSARVFGGRISLTDSIMTSAGTGVFSKGLMTLL